MENIQSYIQSIEAPIKLLYNFVIYALSSFWKFNLVQLNKDYNLSVSTLVLGFLLFFISIKASRFISKYLCHKFRKVMVIDNSAANTVERLTYYMLVIIFLFIILDISHIPLTAFTFIGGALAIAVGFGSQKILTDFISGLIIMIERPIRIGDLVDIDGQSGEIVDIGVRSTQLLTYNYTDIFIPNSVILEKYLTNYNMTGRWITRLTCFVNIDSTKDAEKIESILIDAVNSAHGVLNEPESKVFLTSIEKGFMSFSIYFYVDTKSILEPKEVVGNVNKTILSKVQHHKLKLIRDTYGVEQVPTLI